MKTKKKKTTYDPLKLPSGVMALVDGPIRYTRSHLQPRSYHSICDVALAWKAWTGQDLPFSDEDIARQQAVLDSPVERLEFRLEGAELDKAFAVAQARRSKYLNSQKGKQDPVREKFAPGRHLELARPDKSFPVIPVALTKARTYTHVGYDALKDWTNWGCDPEKFPTFERIKEQQAILNAPVERIDLP